MSTTVCVEEVIYLKLNSDQREIRLLTITRLRWSWFSYFENSTWSWLLEKLHYNIVSWFNTDRSRPIECRLESIPLDKAPPFIALSYVWGDPSDTSTIFVNGKGVEVTKNLAAALRRIRRRCWDMDTFWVDAICINQEDDSEKASQVNLMRDIYTKAIGAYIWLGDDEGDFKTAVKQCIWLRSMSQTFNQLPSATQELLRGGGGLNLILENLEPVARLILGNIEKRWVALHNLLSRPYWTRVWILQEFVLASEAIILCGSQTIDLALLIDAVATCRSTMASEKRISEKLTSYYTAYLGTGEFQLFMDMRMDRIFTEFHTDIQQEILGHDPMTSQFVFMSKARRGGGLLELVISAQDFATSNPLDKVYGVLGMLPAEESYLKADYNRSLPELYVDLIVGGVKSSGSLAYISTGGIGHRSRNSENVQSLSSELPSWVPDFRRRVQPLYLNHPTVPHIPEFRASAESQAEYQFLSDNTVLEAKGFICDTICNISLPFVNDFIADIVAHDLLTNSEERAEEMLSNAMQSLKNCIETIDPDNHTYPIEWLSWRQALFRSILLHNGHINCDEEGKFHCSTCSEQYGTLTNGFMLLLADIGYAELDRPAEGSSTGIPLPEMYDFMWRYFNSAPNSSEPCPEVQPECIGDTVDAETAAYCKKAFALALSGPVSSETSFFITASGLYGISHAKVQQGDEVCILLGCPIPLLIRRLELDTVVVDDCYVFGMMYGEMTEKVINRELELETFRFR